MKASELIKELQRQIDIVGDKEVLYWNDSESTFKPIYSTYSTTGVNECIALDGTDD